MLCGQKLKRPLACWSNIIVSPKNNLKANFKQHHRHLSKKIIRKQRNNCGHTFSKVIHVKKLEKKLRSENLIMGKLREGCSWCKRQEKVQLTQNLLTEHLSYFHNVTSVVAYFHKSSRWWSKRNGRIHRTWLKEKLQSWKYASYPEINQRKYTKLFWCTSWQVGKKLWMT